MVKHAILPEKVRVMRYSTFNEDASDGRTWSSLPAVGAQLPNWSVPS
jgi:hypothetical protein